MTKTYFIILFVGITAMLLYDFLGCLASRKFNFNFGKLSMIAILIQIFITIYATLKVNLMGAVTIAGLIGLVDAIVGYKITMAIQPKMDEEEKILLDSYAVNGQPKVGTVALLVLMSMFWAVLVGSITLYFK